MSNKGVSGWGVTFVLEVVLFVEDAETQKQKSKSFERNGREG